MSPVLNKRKMSPITRFDSAKDELRTIRRLVGLVTKDQLRYVDCFTSADLGLFMPVGGACFYARTPLHSHPSYMFVLHFDEQTSLEIGGRTITSRYGKLFGLPPDVPHHELPSDFPPRYIAVMISRRFFEIQLGQYQARHKQLSLGEFYEPLPDLLPLLKRFMIEADAKAAGSGAVLQALGLEICHCIIRSILDLRQDNYKISSRIEIDRSIEYMHANLGRKIALDDMAKAAYMSPSHFSRIFRQETGASPMDYLARIRMDRVKKLLLAGDKSITEIALECGFSTPAYLSASFYRKFRTTPSDFRKKLNKSSISKDHRRILKA